MGCDAIKFILTLMNSDYTPCFIHEGLYLGSIGAAYTKKVLERFEFTHVLAVARDVFTLFPELVKYKHIKVQDSSSVDMTQHFEQCFAFIDEARNAGGRVLVHCFAGRSRSVTIVIAYLMRTFGLTFRQAFALVGRCRKNMSPNSGFMQQLQAYEQQLLQTSSDSSSLDTELRL